MKVSILWLKELVNLNKSLGEFIELINLRTLGTKEVTEKYIELDMKGYNRADLLSLRGVALESAAILDCSVNFTETNPDHYFWINKSLQKLKINIENKKLTPVYCLAKIEGIKVDKSSGEWVKKLDESGYRSINNAADLTNLLMLEFGQPMHAFDADKIKGDVGVRFAKEGEELLTLDNKKRKLSSDDLLIVDDSGPIGLAGVMGGKDTEISDHTTSILLEAAIFDPTTLRKTATKLGLMSEASKRFYHGLTKKRLLQALDAALRKFEQMGGKVTSLTLEGDFEDRTQKIQLSLAKINSLIGVEFKNTDVEKYLKTLNFEIKKNSENSWIVTPPYYRMDVQIEEDVIEEVARMYGYEKIPSVDLPGLPPEPSDQSLFELIDNVKSGLVFLGLSEVQTYSFYSTQVLEALGVDDERKKSLIRVSNPISAETEYMRENNWANLVEALGKNIKRGLKDIAIFEIGKIYYFNEKKLTDEKFSLSIALMNGSENPLLELLEIFQSLNQKLGLQLEIDTKKREKVSKSGLFHPNRMVHITIGGLTLGGIAEVHKRVLDKMGITKRVSILEIGLSKLVRGKQ